MSYVIFNDKKPIKLSDEEKKRRRFLNQNDNIYYLLEYTTRRNYSYSPVNSFISNIKKKPASNEKELFYKYESMNEIANYISQFETSEYVWVPMPSSKAKNDENYDPRALRILELANKCNDNFSFCDVFEAHKSRDSFRIKNERDPNILKKNWKIVNELKDPKKIVIFDDVLTEGTTFRAASDLLSSMYPKAQIIGFFIALSVWNEES
jgi:predicted amidophosphoribosyltransferase